MTKKFAKEVLSLHKFVWSLSKKDFQTRYLGSFLGILWAFIQPTTQVLIFWFVFQVGFKNAPIDNFPFILWLISAMIPWFFISDCIQNGTTSIIDNGYLVKKVVFRIGVLPFVKIYSAFYVHAFFILFMIVMFMVYGYFPTIYLLQIFYYLGAVSILVLGISLITSSLIIFLKDMGQIVGVLLQIGFWLTPIFYSLDIVPEKYQFLFKLNPFMYIVEGYRETFIYHKWFWEHPKLTLSYWLVTTVTLGVGIFIFKKLRPHFSDVL